MPPRARPTKEGGLPDGAPCRRRARRWPYSKLIALRIGHLRAVFRRRYGLMMPKDDDGALDDLELFLHHVFQSDMPVPRMRRAVAEWAPWMLDVDRDRMIAAVLARPLKFRADTLAHRLGLTSEERKACSAWSIGSIDRTWKERLIDRKIRRAIAEARRRRAKGAKKKVVYLLDLMAKPKPWKEEGVSRATWYRRKGATAA